MKLFGLILAMTLLSACGGGSNDSGGNGDKNRNHNQLKPANPVNWAQVPSEYNPKIEELNFQTYGFDIINLNSFGFNDDVEIIYSSNVLVDSGILRIYKVWNEFAFWLNTKTEPNGTTLDFKNYGRYQCSIKVENGFIRSLKGGCYVKIQVLLPPGTEIEVYSSNKLISKRFKPIDLDSFLVQFKDATWPNDKFKVIEEFLASYNGTSKTPSLRSQHLAVVIDGFLRSEEKFKALRRLHSFVSDRQNLNSMIEAEFSYFDRKEARIIVGL